MTPGESHEMRVDCAERLAKIESKMTMLCKRFDVFEQTLERIWAAHGKHSVDIAVLKTKAALYGAIAAMIVSPIVLIALSMIGRK